MQLASDIAAKPPSPDRVFEAVSVVPSFFCFSLKKSEFVAAVSDGAHWRAFANLGIAPHKPRGRSFFAVVALNS